MSNRVRVRRCDKWDGRGQDVTLGRLKDGLQERAIYSLPTWSISTIKQDMCP